MGRGGWQGGSRRRTNHFAHGKWLTGDYDVQRNIIIIRRNGPFCANVAAGGLLQSVNNAILRAWASGCARSAVDPGFQRK